MIEFKLADENTAMQLYKKCLLTYNANTLAFTAIEKNEMLGYSLFTKSGEIVAINTDIKMMEMPLMKAAMNWMDLNGVKKAYCLNDKLQGLLIKAGFKKENNIYSVLLEGYFTQGC